MKEPTRWRDDASAPKGVRELLGSSRRSRALPGEVRARSSARIDRLLALPVAAGVGLWLKGVAIAAGVGLLGVVVVTEIAPALRERSPLDTPAVRPTAQPAVRTPALLGEGRSSTEPSSSPPHAVPAPLPIQASATSNATPPLALSAEPPLRGAPTGKLPRKPTDQAPTSSAIPSARTEPVNPLAREAALLEEARASLDRRPADALAKLDAHAAEFPSGQLSAERELLAVDALGRLGRVAEARARGEALLARSPGSIYEARVRKLLDALP